MTRKSKLAIVGSRDFPQLEMVKRYVNELPASTIVISGGATGVDAAAAFEARRRQMTVIEIKPDYATWGKRAPLMRNDDIAELCDKMVAFWDGVSTGTAHAIQCAHEKGKEVLVLRPEESRRT